MNGSRISFAFMNIAAEIPGLTDLFFSDYEPRMMYLPIEMTNVRNGLSKLGAM